MNQQINASQVNAGHYVCALKARYGQPFDDAESRSKHWGECFISLA
ncbi:MAG TPA: hypothetical protein VGR30_14375 [Candidatus Binatia bacterium]|jgi:hypothetical protein|nr:hypothetical protein [Candidatus Binatia bacterium]